MKFFFFTTIIFSFVYSSQAFQSTFVSKIRSPKLYSNNENVEFQNFLDNINPKDISFSINKESLEIAERKHSQIAILGVLALLSSEFFLGDYLFEGKGINLLNSLFDDSKIYLTSVITLQSIHELIFRGGFPLNVDNKLLDKEIFFGRLSMLFILFFSVYEIYYDIPLFNNNIKIIINLLFLYLKILFSIKN
jgi:hypothetical protein